MFHKTAFVLKVDAKCLLNMFIHRNEPAFNVGGANRPACSHTRYVYVYECVCAEQRQLLFSSEAEAEPMTE